VLVQYIKQQVASPSNITCGAARTQTVLIGVLWFFSVPSGKCWDNAFKDATDTSHFSFTCMIIWDKMDKFMYELYSSAAIGNPVERFEALWNQSAFKTISRHGVCDHSHSVSRQIWKLPKKVIFSLTFQFWIALSSSLRVIQNCNKSIWEMLSLILD
jgi:hypothetical protein